MSSIILSIQLSVPFNQRPTYYTEGTGREIWVAKNKTATSNFHSNTTEAKFITSSEELELLYKQRLHQEHPCLNKSAVSNLDFNLLEKYTGQKIRETPPISMLSDYGLTSDIPHNGQIYLHNSAVLCFCKQPSNFIRGSSESTFFIGKKTDVKNITHLKGPLSKQIEELFALSLSSGEYFQKSSFIDKNANLIVGLGISEELIRELISNAITHRDYQSPGNVIVRITEDFFEIENPGQFPDGFSWSNLINNEDTRSYPINFSIHQYLKRLLKFEGIGRGFETIREYIKTYGNDSITCETPIPGSCIRIRVLRPKNFTVKSSK
ncbi:transcriptional regulator [Candidatus Magnetomorum sp. HK-1]|nr:transcriptional regulator [Candidatus Magnetomorum sp. HK-1]